MNGFATGMMLADMGAKEQDKKDAEIAALKKEKDMLIGFLDENFNCEYCPYSADCEVRKQKCGTRILAFLKGDFENEETTG